MNPIFTIVFDDNTSYVGGCDYFEMKWKDIPNKKIRTIFYTMPLGDMLVLNGYDKYYHRIEGVKILTGKDAGKMKIIFTYIMGKIKSQVIGYKISTINGNIEKFNVDEKEESIIKLNQEFWK